jgi:TetR/AcrR family transcriptional regulator, repressor of fatR-cypB operon
MNVRSVNKSASSRAEAKRATNDNPTKRPTSDGSARRPANKGSARRASEDDLPRHGGRRGRPLVDDKRRRILDAALRTFAERGYHGTAVPEVAEAAGVGTGTLYRYFEHKEALVNEVYRDAKERLRAALLGSPGGGVAAATDLLSTVDLYRLDAGEQWFAELWRRLGAFARAEQDAFRFLEMQDHVPYLDERSKQVELSLLAPLWIAGKRLRASSTGAPVDLLIALLWGAFVGLVKAGRLGYLVVDDTTLAQAGAACWRLIAPESVPSRAIESSGPPSPSRATSATASRAPAPSSGTTAPRSPSRASTPSRSPSNTPSGSRSNAPSGSRSNAPSRSPLAARRGRTLTSKGS